MRYTIEGFSQSYALTLHDVDVDASGKEHEVAIDCTDLVILRWFVDFYPNMRKMTVDGKEYALLSHPKLTKDLPILRITRKSAINRMQKLVRFGILEYALVKENGTFSLYKFGENYERLLTNDRENDTVNSQNVEGVQSIDYGVQSIDHRGVQSIDHRGVQSIDHGVCNQLTNKDSSIIYTDSDSGFGNEIKNREWIKIKDCDKDNKDGVKEKEEDCIREQGDSNYCIADELDVVDTEWADFVSFYERNIGLFPHDAVTQGDLEDYTKDMGYDVVKKAIEITCKAQVDSPKPYLMAILKKWRDGGITSAQKADAYIADYERKKENRKKRQDGKDEEPKKILYKEKFWG